MQVVQLLMKLYISNPHFDMMPLIRVVIGSDVRKMINWVEFTQTLVNKHRAGLLYRTGLWSCRKETMPIHKFLIGSTREYTTHQVGYDMTMVPTESTVKHFNDHMRPMGHMDKLFHMVAFNPRAILAWAAYANAKVARMVTYGFVLSWTKGGNHALVSRAITLAKMANLKQKDLLLDEKMLHMSWPNCELCWSAPPRFADMNQVSRWNAWVMTNTTAWGIKPNAAAFA